MQKVTRRDFLKTAAVATAAYGLGGCKTAPMSLARRTFGEIPPEKFQEMEDKGSIERTYDKSLNNLAVLKLKGEPYEMGFQHGRLLAEEIKDNVSHIKFMVDRVVKEDMVYEAYDRMAHFIPEEFIQEMRGVAHGSGIRLEDIHMLNAIPEIAEYRQNECFVKFFPESKWLTGSSCSNIVASGSATEDGKTYQERVLDFVRFLNVQKYPIVMVNQPEEGNASMSLGYAGFVGSLTGMNDQKMGFGEMGYGAPPNESLEGIPFPFLFRKLMQDSSTLTEATQMVKDARRTNSYVYMIGDAKGDEKGVLLATNRDEVREAYAGEDLQGEIVHHGGRVSEKFFPGKKDVVYAGQFPDRIEESVERNHGKINLSVMKKMSDDVGSDHNLHNMVCNLDDLIVEVSNAVPFRFGFWPKSKKKIHAGRAATQPWFKFNFGNELG